MTAAYAIKIAMATSFLASNVLNVRFTRPVHKFATRNIARPFLFRDLRIWDVFAAAAAAAAVVELELVFNGDEEKESLLSVSLGPKYSINAKRNNCPVL